MPSLYVEQVILVECVNVPYKAPSKTFILSKSFRHGAYVNLQSLALLKIIFLLAKSNSELRFLWIDNHFTIWKAILALTNCILRLSILSAAGGDFRRFYVYHQIKSSKSKTKTIIINEFLKGFYLCKFTDLFFQPTLMPNFEAYIYSTSIQF